MNESTTATAVPGLWRRPRFTDRLAHRLVDRALQGLTEGRLTVVSPFGTGTYGTSGDLAATLHVLDPSLFSRVVAGGTLAAARAYVAGHWRADDLTAVCRIMARNLGVADRLDRGWARASQAAWRVLHAARRNTRRGSRRNIHAHYDLGNRFFELWLDETMTYSCAIFEREDLSLADAQRAKIDRLLDLLDVRPGDHLLDIGTGWGELALRAAVTRGCRVTTTTISRAQHERAAERVRRAGLADRVTLLQTDYRDLTGSYDRIVSVEMIEAVGAGFLDEFFAACARRLAPDGRLALQAITVPDERYADYLASTDFIRQDVFPGSSLVSIGAMRDAAGRAGLRIETIDDLTPHYARTLRLWREYFMDRLDDVRRLGYSDEFIRRWEFYLASCEAGFAERTTGLVQLVCVQDGAANLRGRATS